MYMNCIVLYFLFLQLSFVATCCDRGKEQERNFKVDVEDVSANRNLSFTFATTNNLMESEWSKLCGQIWMAGPASVWQGTVLQCSSYKSKEPARNLYNCTSSSGVVCECDSSNQTICNDSPHRGGSLCSHTHILYMYTFHSALNNNKNYQASNCKTHHN